MHAWLGFDTWAVADYSNSYYCASDIVLIHVLDAMPLFSCPTRKQWTFTCIGIIYFFSCVHACEKQQ